MKGLLIKDFKLMKGQKNFYMTIVPMAIGITVFLENSAFVIWYMTFIGSLFTLSSISYDEFDNGNAFLFSLPISRKEYVVEKYVFGLIVLGGSWLFTTIFALITEVLKDHVLTAETLVSALWVLPILLFILAVMLPFHLKFGSEKGRIAILGAFGLIYLIGFIMVKTLEIFNINLISMLNNLSSMSIKMLMITILVLSIIVFLISLNISTVIMGRKEF